MHTHTCCVVRLLPVILLQVTIWDPKAGKILRLLKAHEDTVKSAVFCPVNQHNSTNILATAGGYSAILWNPGLSNNNLLNESRLVCSVSPPFSLTFIPSYLSAT